MTFTQAALIVVALAATALALTCYHLLSRLDLLERAVSGGLKPPSRRLTREEFEQRFRRATERSALAREIEHGIVLVVGPEYPDSDIESAIEHLHRGDGLHIAPVAAAAASSVDRLDLPALGRVDLAHRGIDAAALGVGVTPFVFVIDERRIIVARPVASSADLLSVLQQST